MGKFMLLRYHRGARLNLLQTDADLRAQVVERQFARARDFAPATILAQLREKVEAVVGALGG